MIKENFLAKIFSVLLLTGILMALGIGFSYLPLAFGWTNPPQIPPIVGGAITVDSSGNVGIGTGAPGQKLSVAGKIESTTGGVKFPDGTVQTTAGVSYWRAVGQSIANTNSSNVGIGTGLSQPTASALLELKSNNQAFLPPRMTTLNRNAIIPLVRGLVIYNTDTGALETYNGSGWVTNLWTASGSNIYSNNSGNVGIGNNNPGSKLDVSGNINTSGSLITNYGVQVNNTSYSESAAIIKYNSPQLTLQDTNTNYSWWNIREYLGDLLIENQSNYLIRTMATLKSSDGSLKLNVGNMEECSLPKYVGTGNRKTDGSINPDCSAFSGSHVCSPEEMMRSDRCNLNMLGTADVWLMARLKVEAKDGTNQRTVTDCKAWTSNASSDYGFRNTQVTVGSVYKGGYAEAGACNVTRYASCCK